MPIAATVLATNVQRSQSQLMTESSLPAKRVQQTTRGPPTVPGYQARLQ